MTQSLPEGVTPSSIVIPADINQMARETAALLYLRRGLRLQPVYPWDEPDCKDRGKKPRWTLEQRLAATDSEIIRHFRQHPGDNVGLVPGVNNLWALDIDDPSPKAEGVAVLKGMYPWLFGPHYRTLRGPRVIGTCPDVPLGSKYKLTNPDFHGLGMSLELFLTSAGNVVLPPSIHPDSTPQEHLHLARLRHTPGDSVRPPARAL